MAKVAPEGTFCPPIGAKEFKLKKAFKYKPSFTEFPADYLKAKERVGEHFATLQDGRKICYFKDGNDGDTPVICLHGGGESKWYFMQKEPITGIQMISVDRYGYGGTDTIPNNKISDFSWDDVIADMTEFIDVLGFGQVIWWGFSIGSSWAQHLAAALPDRTRGIVICGTMSDTYNKLMTKEEKKKVGAPPGIMNPQKGCCGCILRSVFLGLPKGIAKHDFGPAFDPDFKDKHAKKRFDLMLLDDFWIASKCDALLGFTKGEALMGDAIRSLCNPWKFGPQDIKCPVYIFQADHDEDMGSSSPTSPEFIKRVAPNCIALEWLEGAGHSFTVGPDKQVRDYVVAAVDKMPPRGL
jgi:pimeloyl-ACP methyl ester carboxylesterase